MILTFIYAYVNKCYINIYVFKISRIRFKIKKMVNIVNPKIVTKTTRAGRKIRMVMGTSADSGVKVSRILSNE